MRMWITKFTRELIKHRMCPLFYAPAGSAQNPLTDEELKNKFESLALKRLRQDTIQLIAKKIDAIERIKDIHELCDLVYERSAKAKVVK